MKLTFEVGKHIGDWNSPPFGIVTIWVVTIITPIGILWTITGSPKGDSMCTYRARGLGGVITLKKYDTPCVMMPGYESQTVLV